MLSLIAMIVGDNVRVRARWQVQDLAKDTTPTDLTESLQLLSDTEQLVNDVKKLMEGATTATATNVQ